MNTMPLLFPPDAWALNLMPDFVQQGITSFSEALRSAEQSLSDIQEQFNQAIELVQQVVLGLKIAIILLVFSCITTLIAIPCWMIRQSRRIKRILDILEKRTEQSGTADLQEK